MKEKTNKNTSKREKKKKLKKKLKKKKINNTKIKSNYKTVVFKILQRRKEVWNIIQKTPKCKNRLMLRNDLLGNHAALNAPSHQSIL